MRTASQMTSSNRSGDPLGLPLLVETLDLSPSADPLRLLAQAPTGFQAWWHHDGQTLAGFGVAVELQASGPGRFQDLANQLLELPTDVLAFAGGAFASEPGPPSPSEHLPNAAAWVPELLASSDGETTTLIASSRPGSATRDELRARLARTARRLAAAPSEAYDRWSCPDLQTAALAPNEHDFDEAVSRVTTAIEEGHLSKVVLARRSRTRVDEAPSAALVADALRSQFPHAFVFGLQRGSDLFAGASPELLVRVDGLDVQSTPAAGTAPFEQPLEALHTAKNLHEQALVAEAVNDALRPWCDALTAGDPRTLDAGPVRHLMTDIRGHLRRHVHALSLVQALHPTPAVCGTPTDQALASIAAVEGFDRGWYAGPFGVVDTSGDGTFAIALRAFSLTGHHLDRFAGAGIVAGSDAMAERQEIDAKLSAMGTFLGSLGG